ncbi:hypothetical protein [Acinetobacter boissieri]|uniref:Uncharacterized protein n=1 Tax=Acinetobacter boissieri TaxID=1219383 RepID=A0A1G6JUL3_9GAMM|nr:hypothetical protein [Acinetobacter boissieri]SDC21686.1 hypothetical protein SAMN05421733_11251 [Acinetobacter boissieri]
MGNQFVSAEEFRKYRVEDQYLEIINHLRDLRKYGGDEDFLQYEDAIITLLDCNDEDIIQQAVFTLSFYESVKAKEKLYEIISGARLYDDEEYVRAYTIYHYCSNYADGSQDKALLDQLFSYVINEKLEKYMRVSSVAGMMHIYYGDQITRDDKLDAMHLGMSGFRTNHDIKDLIPKLKPILEGVKSDAYEKFLSIDLGKSLNTDGNLD